MKKYILNLGNHFFLSDGTGNFRLILRTMQTYSFHSLPVLYVGMFNYYDLMPSNELENFSSKI
jgi:hypothetical protein